MKKVILLLACFIVSCSLTFGQKNKLELANRIIYNSPNEKETFIKVANNTATPLNMLFASATPDMGDVETSFMSSVKQTASSLRLLPAKYGNEGKTLVDAFLKTIHNDYFLRYDPYTTMPVTAYNKIFSSITAAVTYSLILAEKNVKSYIYVNKQLNSMEMGFTWGDNLCIFDPSYTSSNPLRIVTNDEKQAYFKRLIQAKIVLESDLNENLDSLYLVMNNSASFFSYRSIAGLIYFNQLTKDPEKINNMETLYSLVKVDLLDSKLLKPNFIESYIAEELKSDRYNIEDEHKLLYFMAMYASSPNIFNHLVEYMFEKCGNQNNASKYFLPFSNDALKLSLAESSVVTINRFKYYILINDPYSNAILNYKASEVLNTLNELMVKDSVINNLNGFNRYYLSLSNQYLTRLTKSENTASRIDRYDMLYDQVDNKNMLRYLSNSILQDQQNEMVNYLSRGKVQPAINLYHKMKMLKGNPIASYNVYNLQYTLESLYNAAKDKGMTKEAQDIRKTIGSPKPRYPIIRIGDSSFK
jgi:hypothetical protein